MVFTLLPWTTSTGLWLLYFCNTGSSNPPMTSHQMTGSCGLHYSQDILCKFIKFSKVSTWNFDWNYMAFIYQIEKKKNVILYWKVITLKSTKCHFLIEITFYVLYCNFSICLKMIWNLPRKSEWWVGHSFGIVWEQTQCRIATKCTFPAIDNISQNSGNYMLEFCVYWDKKIPNHNVTVLLWGFSVESCLYAWLFNCVSLVHYIHLPGFLFLELMYVFIFTQRSWLLFESNFLAIFPYRSYISYADYNSCVLYSFIVIRQSILAFWLLLLKRNSIYSGRLI